MSRHSVAGFNPRHEITVGWDRSMRTFFAIVKDLDIPEAADDGGPDPVILWLGGMLDEIKEVHGLVTDLAPYADLTIGLAIRLAEDQRINA